MGKLKPLPQGHWYTDILTNYTWCIFTKEGYEVVYANLVNLYSMFGGLHKILSDSGTDFKNRLFV